MLRPEDLDIKVNMTQSMPALKRLDLQFSNDVVSLFLSGKGELCINSRNGLVTFETAEEFQQFETALFLMGDPLRRVQKERDLPADPDPAYTKTDTDICPDPNCPRCSKITDEI